MGLGVQTREEASVAKQHSLGGGEGRTGVAGAQAPAGRVRGGNSTCRAREIVQMVQPDRFCAVP